MDNPLAPKPVPDTATIKATYALGAQRSGTDIDDAAADFQLWLDEHDREAWQDGYDTAVNETLTEVIADLENTQAQLLTKSPITRLVESLKQIRAEGRE